MFNVLWGVINTSLEYNTCHVRKMPLLEVEFHTLECVDVLKTEGVEDIRIDANDFGDSDFESEGYDPEDYNSL